MKNKTISSVEKGQAGGGECRFSLTNVITNTNVTLSFAKRSAGEKRKDCVTGQRGGLLFNFISTHCSDAVV